ncbi:MAG: response regulator transcription factor [Bacteroidales bacterium]|nr:response regulator transcription factor [Bacteroidales bacterium]
MMKKIKILLAEDDVNLGSLLQQYLEAKDFDTNLYADGEEAYKAYMQNDFDLCILDVMMPKRDGFELAKSFKTINDSVPIIFLTAKVLKEDVLKGFKIGADDYITKPFNMEELLYRIEAVLRRFGRETVEEQFVFQIGTIHFDSNSQILKVEDNDDLIKLTSKESDLLKLLCQYQNTVMRRDFALKAIWGVDNYFNARSMDVYITKLRKLLLADSNIKIINKHGEGYKLIVGEEEE